MPGTEKHMTVWSPEEITKGIELYRKYGAPETARILGRSIRGVQGMMRRHWVTRTNGGGKYVPLRWVAEDPRGQSFYRDVRLARRDGVLVERSGGYRYWVPEEWADELAERRRACETEPTR